MLQDLPLRHLDDQLAPWREIPYTRPRRGWLRAIRGALGMRVRQFAKAAHVAPSTALAAENAEGRGDITLATLTRYAAILGCEVRYVLVPKKPLQQMVEERAEAGVRTRLVAQEPHAPPTSRLCEPAMEVTTRPCSRSWASSGREASLTPRHHSRTPPSGPRQTGLRHCWPVRAASRTRASSISTPSPLP